MILCIPQNVADKLRTLFKKDNLTIEKLANMTSEQRRNVFSKVDTDKAKEMNALFEKGLVSNQKQAMKNWVWKNFYDGKPLYTGLDIKQSQAMREALTMKDFKGMTPEQRIKKLSEFTNQKVAETLNKRYEALQKTGNLSLWEEKVLGTKKLFEDKKLKGALAKLEVLDDLGLLNPKQTEKFMEDLVSSKLGIDITPEQAVSISNLVKNHKDAFDKVKVWNANDGDNVYNYFKSKHNIEEYLRKIQGEDVVDTANNAIQIMRNNLLGSPRIARNSALYQILPSLERFFTKRIVSADIGNLDVSLMDKMFSKISVGLVPDKQGSNFIKEQLKLSFRIYKDFGYDMARTITLNEKQLFFGEKAHKVATIPFGEAVGVKAKIQAGVGKIAKATGAFPKWFAGGTDFAVSNTTRAETAVLWSREIARNNIKLKPKHLTERQWANQIMNESYSFNPKDPLAVKVREMGIKDAHYSNNTQPDAMADWVVRLRDSLGIGKLKVGTGLVPFAKITTTAISRGIKTSFGIEAITNVNKLRAASKITDNLTRQVELAKATTNLVGTIGLTGTTLLLSSFLGVDDYIPPYGMGDYQIDRARGANPSSVRLFGKWIPLRYLPIINIPLASIMEARRAIEKEENPALGFMKGSLNAVLDTPVIKEASDLTRKLARALTSKEVIDFANSMNMDGESIWEYSKVRAMPSALSYDLYNFVFPKQGKYDFLGREITRGGAFRDDKTNEVILEANNLSKKGHMPVLSDPRGKKVDEAMERLGEEKYEERLNKLKENYAKELERVINTSWYKKLSPEEKKKEWDRIRRREILDRL